MPITFYAHFSVNIFKLAVHRIRNKTRVLNYDIPERSSDVLIKVHFFPTKKYIIMKGDNGKSIASIECRQLHMLIEVFEEELYETII